MSVEYQGNYETNIFNASKRYKLHFQKGVPLSSNELDEMQDVSDSFVRQLISLNFPRASSTNDGFEITESALSTDRNFTIKGGDGTVNGAGVLFVDGYILFLKNDIEYEDQGSTGALTDDYFTETFPTAPALTTPLSTRIDTVYVDFYFAEVSADPGSEYEDPALIAPSLGIATANRTRMVQDIRVAEGHCSTYAQGLSLAGTILIDGTVASGTVIHVDGFSNATGTVYEGTQFTIENDSTIYTVTADATIASNECDLNITPTLVTSADDGEEVSFRIFEVGYPDGNDSNGIYHRYVRVATIIRSTSNDITAGMITDNRIPINSIESYSLGTTVTDLIMSDGQSIGDDLHRIANLYMASTIDYANDLVFSSSGEKIRFTTAGYVGIGTDNPQSMLHVAGSTIFDTEFTLNDLMTINQDENQAALVINQTGSGNSATVVEIDNAGTGHALTVMGGNVGIGTTNPTSTLHVQGDCSISNNLTVNGTTTIINTEVTTADVLQIDQDDNQAALIVNQTGSGNSATVMEINNAGSGHALVIDSGNVGIGTTNPSHTLRVEGDCFVSNTLYTSNMEIDGITASSLQIVQDQNSYALSVSQTGAGNSATVVEISNAGTGNALGVTGTSRFSLNVGVGTATVTGSHMFQVQGTSKLSGGVTARDALAGIGGAISDENSYEVGNGYINLYRDDTASSRQIQFGKNGALHSGFLTDTAGFHIVGSDGAADLTVATTGRIGIGTTSPQRDLDIFSATPQIELSDSGGGDAILEGDGGNLILSADSGNSQSNSVIRFLVDGSEKARVYYDGNMGIATTSPLNTLHVQGTARVTGQTLLLSTVGISTASPQNTLHVQGTSRVTGNSYFYSTAYFTPNVGINTGTPERALDVRGEVRVGDGTTVEQQIYLRSANGAWQVGTNNAGNGTNNNQFYIWESSGYCITAQKGTGNVGIGLTNPQYKLHVNGPAYIDTLGSEGFTFTGDNGFIDRLYSYGGYLVIEPQDSLGIGTQPVYASIAMDTINGQMELYTDTSSIEINGAYATGTPNSIILDADAVYLDNIYGTTRFYGNVGIGTYVPASALDVAGHAYIGELTVRYNINSCMIDDEVAIGKSIENFAAIDVVPKGPNGQMGLHFYTSSTASISAGTDITGTTNDGSVKLCGGAYGSDSYGSWVEVNGNNQGGGLTMYSGTAGDIYMYSGNGAYINSPFFFAYERVGMGTSNLPPNAAHQIFSSGGARSTLEAKINYATTGPMIFRCVSNYGSTDNIVFRVGVNGQVWSEAGTAMSTPADFAEWSVVKGELEEYSLGTIVRQSEDIDFVVEIANDPEFVYGIVTNRAAFCGGLVECNDDVQMKNDFKELSTEELEVKYNARRIAMTGHILCKVIGKINRGQKLVLSSIKGVAKAASTLEDKINSFGIARQPYDSEEVGLIEIKLN